MKMITLVAAAVVIGVAVGGVAVAGMQVMERETADASPADPMTVAKQKFFRTCKRSAKSGAKNTQRCTCLADAVASRVFTPLEFNVATDMVRAILTTGRFLAKERLKAKVRRLVKKYKGKIPFHRGNDIWRTVTRQGLACGRSVQ